MRKIFTLIKTDAYRHAGSASLKSCIRLYLRVPGFRFMCWHRMAHHCKRKGRLLYVIPWLILTRLKYKYGYDIPAETLIGKGFYIGHFGGVVISPRAIIGNNCNISQGVTIGFSSRGAKKGHPEIADGVYLGPGCKVIGKVRIGRNAAVGANAVVVNDVPDNAVAAGIPARIVSMKGAGEYILNQIQ